MQSKADYIRECYPGLILIDGYDDCIVGIVDRIGSSHCVCYDELKILHKLEESGMNTPEADEFFEFNILGSYLGEHTPCFVEIIKEN